MGNYYYVRGETEKCRRIEKDAGGKRCVTRRAIVVYLHARSKVGLFRERTFFCTLSWPTLVRQNLLLERYLSTSALEQVAFDHSNLFKTYSTLYIYIV